MTSETLARNRFGLSLFCCAVVCFAFIALLWPVRLDAWDRFGFRISCGDGGAADYAQAAVADHEAQNPSQQKPTVRLTDYVADCQSATWWRRGWTVPLVLLGVAGLLTALLTHERRPTDAAAANGQPSQSVDGTADRTR